MKKLDVIIQSPSWYGHYNVYALLRTCRSAYSTDVLRWEKFHLFLYKSSARAVVKVHNAVAAKVSNVCVILHIDFILFICYN